MFPLKLSHWMLQKFKIVAANFLFFFLLNKLNFTAETGENTVHRMIIFILPTGRKIQEEGDAY